MGLAGVPLVLLTLALNVGAPVPATAQNVVDDVRFDVETVDGQIQGIRLAGVASDELCSTDATRARTRDLISAQVLDVQLTGGAAQPDADGRLPAYVWLPDGDNLAQRLIQEGDVAATHAEAHALQADFTAAQRDAMARHAGIWAPGACPALSDVSGFVDTMSSTIQRARTAINILHDQARSAPQVASSSAWQSTTTNALDSLRSSAGQLQATPDLPSSVSDLRATLVRVGTDLSVETDAYTQAATSADLDQLQSSADRLDASADELKHAFADVVSLSANYGVGD